MDARDILADGFGRVREGIARVVDGLTAEELAYRPDPGANSIAWLIWHLTRVQDDHVSEIAGREQAWTSRGWFERLGLDLPVADTGYGHGPQQVAAVRIDDPSLLVGYHEDVVTATLAYLPGADAVELERIIDDRWDPPVSVGVRLVSVIDDQAQHIGQAAYVRGLIERRR